MRALFLFLCLALSAAAPAETRAQIHVEINPAPSYAPNWPEDYPAHYPSRSYYYYDGLSQNGGGRIQTEQYSRGGFGYTEHHRCHTSAGSTICTGNWRPVSPVRSNIRIDYRR